MRRQCRRAGGPAAAEEILPRPAAPAISASSCRRPTIATSTPLNRAHCAIQRPDQAGRSRYLMLLDHLASVP